MKYVIIITALLMSSCGINRKDLIRHLEEKMKDKVVYMEVLEWKDDIHVIRYDWKKDWWGSFDVVEIQNGKLLRWLKVSEAPTAQCLYQQSIILINDRKYLQIIDRTHMGNSMAYYYDIRDEIVTLAGKARIGANLGQIRFREDLGNVQLMDVNEDGLLDIVIEATVLRMPEKDGDGMEVGPYRATLLANQSGDFEYAEDLSISHKEYFGYN